MKDVFICHASEDKKDVVIPLVNAFAQSDITLWLDKKEILWGDSLIEKVNEGLRMSHYVIVVLSKSSISKNWPKRELNSVLNIEASTGDVRVLPLIVGHGNTPQEILKEYPLLNDKLYLTWKGDPKPVVEALNERLRKTERQSDAENISKQEIESVQDIFIPRVKKQFTQQDKDRFLTESFETIKTYFQKGLNQLKASYEELDTDFIKVNNLKFLCKVYMNGDLRSQCKIWLDNTASYNSIGYFEGTSMTQDDNTFNEQITVINDDLELHLKFLIGSSTGQLRETKFLPINAAEQLWKRFVSPLER